MDPAAQSNKMDFKCSKYFPVNSERKLLISNSYKPFRIKLNKIEGLKKEKILEQNTYHIKAVLFDQRYGNFVGSYWNGQQVQVEEAQILFNESFYFYTSIPSNEMLLVIELISKSKESNLQKIQGWTFVPFVENQEESNERKTTYHKLPLFSGTPLILIPKDKKIDKTKSFWTLDKKNSKLLRNKIIGLEINISISSYQDLLLISHLIPENVPIDASTKIPGILPLPKKAIKDPSFVFKPKLQQCISFLLENVYIKIHPSLDEAEEEILSMALKAYEKLYKSKTFTKDQKSCIAISQRRLNVSVHNSYCFIQDSNIYNLNILHPNTPGGKSILKKASSMGSINHSQGGSLVLQSDIKLENIPDDPDITLIFLLEYIISMPSAEKYKKKEKNISNLNLNQTSHHPLAWGFCKLFSLKKNPLQHISLTIDINSSPFDHFFIQTKKEFKLSFSAYSLLKQGKKSQQLSSEDSMSITSESSAVSSYFRSQPYHSTPKHKSLADIPATIQDIDKEFFTNEKDYISHPQSDNMASHEVTLVSSSLPLIPPMIHSLPLDSSNLFSKLYWDKLPPVLDHNGKPAYVVDHPTSYKVEFETELNNLPQRNECKIHLLGLSSLIDNVDTPEELFFTFQFYRFLPIRTESMALKALSEELISRASLAYALCRKNMTDENSVPGYEVTYDIDPTELGKDEYYSFLKYLVKQTLQIDLWNGQSLLYFGSILVPLKYFCRQGKEAIISNLELEIFNCMFSDDTLGQSNILSKSSIGRILLRISNVRHPLSTKALEKLKSITNYSKSAIVYSRKDMTAEASGHIISRPKPIVEINKELSEILSSKQNSNCFQKMTPDPQLSEERRIKLARMAAVRKLENANDEEDADMIMQSYFSERQQDLLNINSYIEKNKPELIRALLHKSITSEKYIYPVIGNKEFFEFVIENPFSVPKQVEIIWNCSELSLLTNIKLWQAFRTNHYISQKVDMQNFRKMNGDTPTILLQAKQKVHVPFTYQCVSFNASPFDMFKAVSSHYFRTTVLSSMPNINSSETTAKIRFVTEDQTLLAVLNLIIQPLPPSFSHIFKFISMEHSMFNEIIQLNKNNNQQNGIQVMLSNPDIVCTLQESHDLDENLTLHIKAPTKSSGKSTDFYLFIFTDKYQSLPSEVWSVTIHPLQRIDLPCIAGQLMRSSLLIRGTHATNLVKCFSSSQDLQLHPSNSFLLSPFAVQELSMNIRCLLPGTKYFQITMVNQALQQLLQSWLLVISCQKPSVSKAFQIYLSVGKEAAKRITYTNPYTQTRSFTLLCSHPHLLLLRESQFTIAAGENYSIGIYFLPQDFIFTETVFLYMNDSSDKNEDTFCIKLVCQ